MIEQLAVNLCDLWCHGIDDRVAVLHGDNQTSSRRELFAAAHALSSRLLGKRVAIFCNSSHLEAIAFLAAMRVSAPVVFPSTNQIETLKEISGSFDVLVTDEIVALEIEQISVSDFLVSADEPVAVSDNPMDENVKMTFFTSGSTGKPKEIEKFFFQMDREIRVWEDLYGVEFAGAEIHSTVSHQHIYGLLFRLLWPLCAGRPFQADTAKNWEEIDRETSHEKPFILISSPTHLSRLSPLENGSVSLRPLIVFSAGGVLHDEFASQAAQYLGRPVLEVYGSTETGAMAKRHNDGSGTAWQLLPGVSVSQDHRNCLRVKSAFLADPEEVFQTEDLASFEQDGSFVLQGRVDRIVKVEGKRVSLPRTEELLRKQAWVTDIHTKMIGKDRPVLGAVVVLSEAGSVFLSEHGKFRTGRSLREHLKQFDDAVTAPRRWRFVNQIPRNTQGKIRPSEIDALFESDWGSEMGNRQAFTHTSFVELAREVLEDTVNIRFYLPENLDFFRGHFTGTPLLPGVVQLHWAVEFANQLFDVNGQPRKIEKLKFKQFLFPEMEAQLTLSFLKEGKISFLYSSIDELGNSVDHSSGTLNYLEGK